ncbi:VOC family protein [Thalassobius sp. I31.1]|uniref:VOC family protein n=1 Tax=Thalassobius sp. I31.1 TaxID=2109912 RepID=UPI000D1BCD2A|nr:VOC family protein [Thalassobius sp. I31.1]
MSLVTTDNTITLSMSVTDRHASAAWYEKMLGFKLRYHADDVGWSEMETNTPGVTLGFGERSAPAPGNCVPVFGTTDLDNDRAKLEAAGVKFDGDTEVIEGMVKLATIYDPDGNALMLAQNLSGQ